MGAGMWRGFADGLNAGARLGSAMRESEWQDKQRERQQMEWDRQDKQRASMQQLAYDTKNGTIQDGTDNSFDVAEGKRLGMPVQSTIQRQPLAEADVEKRFGNIALDAGDMTGYRQSLVNQKALEKEAAAKAFGADLQAILKGDQAALGKYAQVLNNSGTLPGMLILDDKDQPRYADPKTGRAMPISYAEIAQNLGAFHAMGQGDWQVGMQLAMQQQNHRETRADAELRNQLAERTTANQELATRQQGEYQKGSLANDAARTAMMDRHYKAVEGIERGKAGAANQMGKFGPARDVIGPDGQPSTIVPVMGRDGSISYQTMPLPDGYRLPKQVDPRLVESRAAALDGRPTGRTINGKPELYTPESAYEAAYRMVVGSDRQAGGAPARAVAGDADAVVNFLRSEADKSAAPKKPQGAMPGRGESTSQAERLRQMYLGGQR